MLTTAYWVIVRVPDYTWGSVSSFHWFGQLSIYLSSFVGIWCCCVLVPPFSRLLRGSCLVHLIFCWIKSWRTDQKLSLVGMLAAFNNMSVFLPMDSVVKKMSRIYAARGDRIQYNTVTLKATSANLSPYPKDVSPHSWWGKERIGIAFSQVLHLLMLQRGNPYQKLILWRGISYVVECNSTISLLKKKLSTSPN